MSLSMKVARLIALYGVNILSPSSLVITIVYSLYLALGVGLGGCQNWRFSSLRYVQKVKLDIIEKEFTF